MQHRLVYLYEQHEVRSCFFLIFRVDSVYGSHRPRQVVTTKSLFEPFAENALGGWEGVVRASPYAVFTLLQSCTSLFRSTRSISSKLSLISSDSRSQGELIADVARD